MDGKLSNFCCDAFAKAVEEGAIQLWMLKEYWMEKTHGVDDGDGRVDEITDWSGRIYFCPFCGVKIETTN